MVQTNKGVGQCAAFELAIERRERLGADKTACAVAIPGVQHGKKPVPQSERFAVVEISAAQNFGHQGGIVVIAGEKINRCRYLRQQFANGQVGSARVILA